MVAAASQSLAQQLDFAIKRSAEILHPKLRRVLRPGINAGLGLSFSIQDGTLCHIRETDEDRHGPRLPAGLTDVEPAGEVVTAVLKSIIVTLRVKLEMTMVAGYFGVVILTVDVDNGESNVTCGTEKIHKIASGRVPT